MKSTVSSLVRNHRPYRPLSRLRCLSTANQLHPAHRSPAQSQRLALFRNAIACSPSRSQSTDSKPLGKLSDDAQASKDTALRSSATDAASQHSQPLTEESSDDVQADQGISGQTTPSSAEEQRLGPLLPATRAWKDFQRRAQEPPDDEPHQGEGAGEYTPFPVRSKEEVHKWMNLPKKATTERNPREPRLEATQHSAEELGYTPQPLTAPRGEGFAAAPYAEDQEDGVVRPLTDRPMGSGQDKEKAEALQAKADIAARKAKEPSYSLTFTCAKCLCCSTHVISKQAYHGGTVLVNCPGCKNKHLISDHLGIFSDRKVTLEDIMKEKGQLLKKGVLGADGNVEFY